MKRIAALLEKLPQHGKSATRVRLKVAIRLLPRDRNEAHTSSAPVEAKTSLLVIKKEGSLRTYGQSLLPTGRSHASPFESLPRTCRAVRGRRLAVRSLTTSQDSCCRTLRSPERTGIQESVGAQAWTSHGRKTAANESAKDPVRLRVRSECTKMATSLTFQAKPQRTRRSRLTSKGASAVHRLGPIVPLLATKTAVRKLAASVRLGLHELMGALRRHILQVQRHTRPKPLLSLKVLGIPAVTAPYVPALPTSIPATLDAPTMDAMPKA